MGIGAQEHECSIVLYYSLVFGVKTIWMKWAGGVSLPPAGN